MWPSSMTTTPGAEGEEKGTLPIFGKNLNMFIEN